MDPKIWLALLFQFWKWNFQDTQPRFVFNWIEAGPTRNTPETNVYMSGYVFVLLFFVKDVLPCLKMGNIRSDVPGKVYLSSWQTVHNKDKLIRY